MSKKPASAGKIVGITCVSMVGLLVVLPLLTVLLSNLGLLGDIGSPVLLAALVVGVVLIIRSSRKRDALRQLEAPVAPVTQVATQVARPTAVASTGGELPTTVCPHSFNAEDRRSGSLSAWSCSARLPFKCGAGL